MAKTATPAHALREVADEACDAADFPLRDALSALHTNLRQEFLLIGQPSRAGPTPFSPRPGSHRCMPQGGDQRLQFRAVAGQQPQEVQQSGKPGGTVRRVVRQPSQLRRKGALHSGFELIEPDGQGLPLGPGPHANTLGSIVAPRMKARYAAAFVKSSKRASV